MLCAGGNPDACHGQRLPPDVSDKANDRSAHTEHYKDKTASRNAILTVQATKDVIDQNVKSPWLRANLQAPAHLPMQMVDWALEPWSYLQQHEELPTTRLQEYHAIFRTATVFVETTVRVGLILLRMQLPLLSSEVLSQSTEALQPSLPQWPRFSRNKLDMRPNGAHVERSDGITAGGTVLFKATRSVPPQILIMYADKSWIPVRNPPSKTEYAFVSWHWSSFGYDRPKTRTEALTAITAMAQHATLNAGLKAYWLDVQCMINEDQGSDSIPKDVYDMSEIVRNAHHVAVMLPDGHSYYKRAWARRLWTIPEKLLANGKLRVWTDMKTGFAKQEVDRVQLTCEFWRPFENDERQHPTRLLAEYYENRIELSRLELVAIAIAAISGQEPSKFTQADIAYALMGLLRMRIRSNKEDTLFQAMTKLLSLTDNNEYVIERMLSSSIYPVRDSRGLFKKALHQDQFGTYIWDIWARCEVVGVDEHDGVVYLNDCRTLPINHRSLPTYKEKAMNRLRPFLQPTILFFGLVLLGLSFLCSRHRYLICVPLTGVIFLTSLLRTLLEKRPHDEEFILIEGALPLSELETIIFGSRTNTLTYATFSSPLTFSLKTRDPSWLQLQNRHRWIRELYHARATNSEPDWIKEASRHSISPTAATSPTSPKSPSYPFLRRSSSSTQDPTEVYHPPLFPGHTLFTLLHVPSGKVSLIQTRRPPTTILLAGSEGGMLRAVLCSSGFDVTGNEVLKKETVVRLSMDVWERASPRSWLRVDMI